MTREPRIKQIAGAGGGGKRSARSGAGGGAIEHPNSLKSKQVARIIDLLSEGPVRGLATWQDVWFDGVPLQNPDGTYNFSSLVAGQVAGWPDQATLPGFAAQQAETAVGVQVKHGTPVVRSIADTNASRCRVTLSVPSLQWTDKSTGTIWGATVEFAIYVQSDGGGWIQVGGPMAISGKTNTRYQRAYAIALPGTGPWDIRVDRLTADSTVAELQNDLYFDSYTTIIDANVNYTLSACVGLTVDAEQFQTVPKRTYRLYGLGVNYPSNYDPINRTYTGVWDGTMEWGWTNNPAWVLFDLIGNPRYGLGQFISKDELDKWAFYRIAQWCDGRVPDGKGGDEPRFVCNVVIRDQQEAFDLVNSMAAIFRGYTYWSGGMLVPFADMPSDTVGMYTNANVIDGLFTYAGGDVRARHTVAHVSWNDPDNLGEPRIAVVEDQAAVSRYGIQKLDIIAAGCTSEGQAIRTGKWALYTEQNESETVTFKAGLDFAWCRPGDIIEIADVTISGERVGGRVVEGYIDHIITDAPPTWAAPPGPSSDYLTCMMPNGSVEMRPCHVTEGSTYVYLTGNPFSAAPLPDSVWIIHNDANLQPTYWRVVNITEPDRAIYEITAMTYNWAKWEHVERNVILYRPDITNIGIPTVTSLTASDYLVALSPISVGVRMLISWISAAPSYEVSYRPVDGNWIKVRTDQLSMDVPAEEGTYDIWVTPLSSIGQRGPTAKIKYEVIGRFAPPEAPQQFRIKISDGVALFEWLPATEIDVIIGGHFELRHSSRTIGATWASAQMVVPSIPGSATTVEAVYRVGTWFLRTFDIVGLQSVDVATIISLQPDGRYNEFARICENPDWLGDHNYTEIRAPQNWLVIGQTGGLWDDQLADMDDWPDVDVLVEGMPDPPQSEARHGWYVFEDRIDAGGVFTVRFAADILAFPYADNSDFIDDRLNNCDEWQDWDNVSEDLGGQVEIYIRTTNDDPASPSAFWSDWKVFSPVEYTARGFEFRADLYAPAGQNIGVEELCIIADLRMKMDSGEDIPYPAATTHVTFKTKFYLVPAVVITVQNALATDTIQVINKTREGFDLTIQNPPPTHVTRTFDWQSRGF